ncbi:MAG: hypothetical protein ACJATW_000072 [Glaciecola sp.]
MVPAWEAILEEKAIVSVADYVMLLDAGATEDHLPKVQYE